MRINHDEYDKERWDRELSVPEGYFEALPQRIMQRIEQYETHSSASHRGALVRFWQVAAATIVLAVSSWAWYWFTTQQTTQVLHALSDDSLLEYLEYEVPVSFWIEALNDIEELYDHQDDE